MNTSPTITKIAIALTKAQKNIGAASKDAQNPFFSSKYADLGSVMAVCKEPLLAEGISVLQPVMTRDDGELTLETILLHESGEFFCSSMKITAPKKLIVPKDAKIPHYFAPDPQAEGSAITYARRYALQSMVFIPSVDNDAEWEERSLSRRPEDKIDRRDRKAIEAIIAQYSQELETEIPKERRQEILGLRSELVCQLADLDVPAAPEKPEVIHAETTVEPPAEKKTRKPREKAALIKPPASNEPSIPWQEVVCHVGSATGTLFGRKLGQLFKAEREEKNITGLVDYFTKQVGNLTAPNAKDAALWKAVQAAHEWWNKEQVKLPQTPASEPEPASNDNTAPKAADPAPAVREAHGWREYVIKSKSPDWNSKTLGSLTLAALQTLESEYLSKIDPARATLDQRALKANVALALSELTNGLPPAATGIPEHTAQLIAAITESRLNRNDFMKECQREGYIRETYSKIEEITEDEAHSLLAEWQAVEKLVRAAMP